MDEHKQKELVRHSVDARLSGLQGNPWLAQRVLANAKGEQKVKKKISVGFVLVVVLVLAAVTALAAITLNTLYERTIEMEGQSGLIQDWSTANKLALVDWMVEAGVELNEEQVAKLRDSSLSDADQGELAMRIINGYYPARDGILTSVDIIAKDKGPIEYWTLDDRAWLSDMLAKYQPETIENERNLLPQNEDITQEEAENIFFDYLMNTYNLNSSAFDMKTLTVSFGENTFDDGSGSRKKRCWVFNIDLIDGTDAGGYIGADGTIIDISKTTYEPEWKTELDMDMLQDNFFTIEGMYSFDQKWRPRMEELLRQDENINHSNLAYFLEGKHYGLPSGDDISYEKAYEKACNAITNHKGFPQNVLDYYDKTHEAYRTDDPNNPVYWFTFFRIWQNKDLGATARNLGLPVSITVLINSKTGAISDFRMSGLYFSEPTDIYGM